MFRAGVNSNIIDQFNYNSIPELKSELEFKDLEQLKLEMIFFIELEFKDFELDWN